jgi:hypothetical protein
MPSNDYNPFNYPYQQSSAQQYSAYQTASASNNVAQSSRQYQQSSTTQAQDYTSYQPQSYANRSNKHGTGQDNLSNRSSYGGTRETTNRTAEVLRNMSNPSYTGNSTSATTQAGFTATNATNWQFNRYANGSSHSPQVQAQQTHFAYRQSQPRPHNVNTSRADPASRSLPSPVMAAGSPSQRAQSIYNQQPQHCASHTQPHDNPAPVCAARNAAMTVTTNQQRNDYSGRQLPSVEASCSLPNVTSSTSYNHGNAQIPSAAIAPPAPSASMTDTYSAQSTTTVDPMAVYDPWPEYQRKQVAQKTVVDIARAAEERIAEEARKAEEQRKEEEHRRQEEYWLRQPKPKLKEQKTQKQQPNTTEAIFAAPGGNDSPEEALKTEIRAMMAKMRELNSKDPALLARIWEEERKAKVLKSPTTQNKTTPQATAAQPIQASTPQVANSRKKTVPREAVNTSVPRPAPPAVAQAVPFKQAVTTASRPTGNTVWPPEKKTLFAIAATVYLNGQNVAHRIEPSRILSLLHSNPSYIELCEQLEEMGLKLDRAVFAKSLLTAVPDANSASYKSVHQPAPVPVQRAHIPPAVMKETATPVAPNTQHKLAAASPADRSSFPPFPDNASHVATPMMVAEMVPIKPELRKPANKEEAARKRNLSDLIDLTQLSEEEDMGPPLKRLNANSIYAFEPPHPHIQDAIVVDKEPSTPNFPIANVSFHPTQAPVPQSILPPSELRHRNYVEPLDKKKALRRNQYNPATIARDVLLACGRHPSERQLNQHLDVLRTTLPQISFDADLSTIRWDLIDPGNPPPGYFKDSVEAFTEDANDEDNSDDEEREPRPRVPSNAIGGQGGAQVSVQALPQATNPFKQKRRGRPPRHSFPQGANLATPERTIKSPAMSSSAPRHTSAAAGVGYQAFRSATEYGSDGQPLPKKRGRPVGWRKAIHGSATAQARPSASGLTGPLNQHEPAQPSSLRNVRTGENEPIRIDSRSSSVANRAPKYQSYKCKWQNCKADLHNLETLKKHIFKVHCKETLRNTLECLWDDCGKEVTNYDPMTNMRIERHQPHSFDLESNWRDHIQQNHFDPLSWELGDGPASGLSGKEDNQRD